MNKVESLISRFEDKIRLNIVLFFIFIFFALSSIFLVLHQGNNPEFDELAYISHVETIYESDNYWYLGDRNRMPLFNYLLFISHSENLSIDSQYRYYQLTNIFFVIFFSYIYSLKLKKYFNSKVYFYCCVVFTIFLPIISYIHDVVVEPLFYITYGLFCLYAKDLLEKPDKSNYLKFSIVSTVLYLLKATGLNLFITSLIFIFLINFFTKRIPLRTGIINSIMSFIFFITLCSPYLLENYDKFNGHLFYNVNTTFYVWYDSWEEVESGTKLFGDRVEWPKMPENEIPSLEKYFNDHTLDQITKRFFNGFKSIFNYYTSLEEFTGSISLSIILLYCFIIYIKTYLTFSKSINSKKEIFSIYIFFNTLILLTGSAWYSYIAPIPRFTILTLIPIYFLLFKKIDEMCKKESNSSRANNLLIIFLIFLITQGTILIYQL